MTSHKDLFERAAALARAGHLDEAFRTYEIILRKDPGNPQAGYRIAVVELMRGRTREAIARLENSLKTRPDDPDILFSLGRAKLSQGAYEQATGHLARAADAAPERADIRTALGDAHFLQGALEPALRIYQAANDLSPGDPRIKVNMANAYSRLGDHPKALSAIAEAESLAPDRPEIAFAHANILRASGDLGAARAIVDTLLAQSPDNTALVAFKAELLDRAGETPAAAQLLAPLLETDPVPHALARAFGQVAINDRQGALPPDAVCALLERALRAPKLLRLERRGLLFMQAALLQKAGRTEDAFATCTRANDTAAVTYDADAVNRRFDRYRNTFSLARLPRLARSTTTDPTPLFIVGMPRSGTTLIEQILDSHPEVAGGGELGGIPGAARALADYPDALEGLNAAELDAIAQEYLTLLRDISGTARFVTDKMPINAEHLGFIWQLFPGARVIHCQRHPLAVGLSCYFQNFRTGNAFTFSLDGFAHYYRHYDALMQHWKATLDLPILDLRYEAVVADPHDSIETLLGFCGLPWDDACLAFDRNKRFVDTLSYAQVRQPMTREPAARHRKYARELAPLAEALAEEIARYEAGT